MPTLTVYRHGLTAGVPPSTVNHKPALRGDVSGWSADAARRNVRFLYSVTETALTGQGFAFTLTLRECPATHDEWHRLRRAWIKRMERMGMTRMHWVTEWQRRGVPHLHGVAYFPHDKAITAWLRLVPAWLEAGAFDLGAKPQAQHQAPIHDAVGWLQYLAKHAARGVRHYQRCPENIPPAWAGKTGRVWGHVGDWPREDGDRLSLDGPAFYAFRRLVRSWRVADARASGDRRRILSARRMLACRNRVVSELRGVSEWIPQTIGLSMVAIAAQRGRVES